ncbi:BA75_02943T0 [Komagataella pastoris]|uniref:BA75_02943T0 n=1 Tax=Komagataella pastoris TaxID=4922 RepID=A0A1B2JA38_PICPA|nr:BA75_02943T0 [Komagataella pastoris]
MTSIKPFQATDLFDINPVNLDVLTENYQPFFYLQYLVDWPPLFFKSVSGSVIDSSDGSILRNDVMSGYMMGKTEGKAKEWHTHITAVTVNPTYRRLGLASFLCEHLDQATDQEPYNTYFVDLFVRVTNKLAISMYHKLGYSVYRRVVGYYGDGSNENRNKLDDNHDAFDMRKSQTRDVKKETVRENGEKVNVLPYEVVF